MPWQLTGNSDSDPTTSYIGTTDGKPLVIQPTGKVGIGLRAPETTLHVNGAVTVSSAPGGDEAQLVLSRHDGPLYEAGKITSPGGSLAFSTFAGSPVTLPTPPPPGPSGLGSGVHIGSIGSSPGETQERMRIDLQGNVGIGTDQPGAMLDVRGQASIQGPLSINHAGVTGVGSPGDQRAAITFGAIDTPAAFYLGAYEATTAKGNTLFGLYSYQFGNWLQFWSPNGNVGIGTPLPTSKLTVNGDVSVTGDVVLTGADCAEEFDIAEAVDFEPGTVMVIDQDGFLQQSHQAYDKRVAGVISGAGDYRPGLVLDRRQSQDHRLPVALVGKVYCKVDARYGPIEVGDLLTTSPTPGHAMKAADPLEAFGSVLGKALRRLSSGQDLIPILVALQ